MGAEPCRLADAFSLDPHEAAEQRREQQAHHNLGDLCSPREIGKIFL
jgi:hypothetical protein